MRIKHACWLSLTALYLKCKYLNKLSGHISCTFKFHSIVLIALEIISVTTLFPDIFLRP